MNALNQIVKKNNWANLIDSLEQGLPSALRGKKITVILILLALVYFFISVFANLLDVSIPVITFLNKEFYKLFNWLQWLIIITFWFLTSWVVKGISYHLGIKNGIVAGEENGILEGKKLGLREGIEIGIVQGMEIGFSNGFVQGNEKGKMEGNLVGTEKGKEEGYNKGLVDGIAKGNQQGFELGYNKALKSKNKIYEPLIENCENYLVNNLSKHKLENIGHSIIQKLSSEPEGWSKYLEYAIADYTRTLNENHLRNYEELASNMIETYFDATIKTRSEKFGDPLLISNFNIYAECVNALLDTLVNSSSGFGKTVIVWTLLDNPLIRWYNMVNISSKNFFITTPWWEKYKNTVANMKNHNKFQMRRLACKRDFKFNNINYDTDNLYVYKNAKCQKIGEIENIISAKTNVDIIPCILESMKYKEYADTEVVLIGTPNGNNISDDWTSLIKHFEKTYHSTPKEYLKDYDKGVFHGYINNTIIEEDKDLAAYLDYDDIFIIQFDQQNDHIDGFGIALNLSEKSDTDGIKLLSGNDLHKTQKALKTKWNERTIEWNNKK
jgi:hypothetical protein